MKHEFHEANVKKAVVLTSEKLLESFYCEVQSAYQAQGNNRCLLRAIESTQITPLGKTQT